MVYSSLSANQTQKIAAKIALQFKKNGGVIALIGDLGSGKTTFSQGFAKSLGITDKIISPTFVLIRQHQLPESERQLFHIDLYRLEGEIDPNQLGLKELLEDQESIVLIEWAEKINGYLPKKAIRIQFKKISQNERQITILN